MQSKRRTHSVDVHRILSNKNICSHPKLTRSSSVALTAHRTSSNAQIIAWTPLVGRGQFSMAETYLANQGPFESCWLYRARRLEMVKQVVHIIDASHYL